MTLRTRDTQPPYPPELGTEAGHWLLRLLDTDPEPNDPYFEPAVRDEAFMDWLTLSPQHTHAFLATVETYYKLGQIDQNGWNKVQGLLQNRNADVIRIYGSEPRPPVTPVPRVSRRKVFGVAAMVAMAALVAALALWNPWGTRVYSTALGEQSTYKLDDGSMVYLNTASRLEVNFAKHVRNLRLVQGEALFVVEHDSSRPFIVKSGDATVRAVGTQFNVRKRDGATEVAVVEGVVQVTTTDGPDQADNNTPAAAASPSGTTVSLPQSMNSLATGSAATEPANHSTRLAAGQEARVAGGHITARATPAVAETLSWRQRRLIFHDASLTEVAAEFNRYNRIQVRVDTPNAQEKRLTGIFDADRPQSLLLYCAQDDSLVVEPEGNNWVIRSR